MQKNYEQLKQYLHSEKAKPEKQILKSRELSMHTDENNIVTSYPNKDVQEERFVIRPKYRNIRIPRHRHEYIELSFMLDGEISMEIDGTPIKMSSGDICLMNKNIIHSSEKIGDDIWMFNILMTADFFDHMIDLSNCSSSNILIFHNTHDRIISRDRTNHSNDV